MTPSNDSCVSNLENPDNKQSAIDVTHVSKLVCDTRESGTESGRGHLCEMDRNLQAMDINTISRAQQKGDQLTYDSPCTLHTKLDTKRAS